MARFVDIDPDSESAFFTCLNPEGPENRSASARRREWHARFRDRILHLGHVGGAFLDGRTYRPCRLIGESDDLQAEIIRLHERKRRK